MKIIMVRYGSYFDPEHLNIEGTCRIESLSQDLKPLVSGKRVVILTAGNGRSRESAEILGAAFGVKPQEERLLMWFCHDNLERLWALVRSRKDDVDVLVLVAGSEYVREFPFYYDTRQFGASKMLLDEVRMGEAKEFGDEERTVIYH